MKTSQVDLFGAWNIIKLVLSNQLKRLEEVQSQQQASTPIDISGPLYSNIRGWLSHEALRQLDNQRQRLLREYPACTGVTARTLGLPCAHMLQPLIQLDEPLLLEQIHPHWLLHRPGTPRIIIEPHKLFNRLAASSKLPPTSTQQAREAWYATVPRGGLRTNQQYRKQMGPRCREKSGTREWTKEEQFSYLDWDKAENERVEQNVGEEMAEKPFLQRRGM
ncbi:hypothetical protein HZ326_28959 [Fusarium oxysporum f. sp. albedinis]|nr:hypothetical protein HZ326_28959 [Fusarium oxysporum f. sp. albedinis]